MAKDENEWPSRPYSVIPESEGGPGMTLLVFFKPGKTVADLSGKEQEPGAAEPYRRVRQVT